MGNACTAYGLASEKDAFLKISETCPSKILRSGLIVHPNYPFLGFSPDGLIIENDNSIRLLEIKCPIEGKNKTATELVEHLNFLSLDEHSKYVLKKKHAFYGQIQLGLFLLGSEKCDFIIYSSYDSSFFKMIVVKDEKFLLKLLPCLSEVYFKYVLPVLAEL